MPDDSVPAPNHQYSPPTDALPEKSMSADETREELRQAIQGSNQVLSRSQTVFTLFPDTMVIDRAKVTVAKRQFYRMAEVMSVRIEDVLNATCTVGPVFGSVTIVSRVMNDNQSTTIGRFRRGDAIRLKRILQGYIIALQRKIDCKNLETRELSAMLEKLGADDHPS